MFERTTRLCSMSPTMATLSPASFPLWRRIVKASSSAWVGCSWAPSPALITPASMRLASMWGTPGWAWRMTTRSGAMACRLSAVSISVSPFSSAEPEVEKLMLSADRRFSAISKLERVRVEASKKRLSTVLPRRVGTFLIARSPISANDSAVSRISPISAGESSAMPSRSLRRQRMGAFGVISAGAVRALQDAHLLGLVGGEERDLDDLALRGRDLLAHEVGLDRQLAVAAVDQHGELHDARPAEVDQLVERRAHGAAGVEDVVAEDDPAVVDRPRQMGPLDQRLRADGREIVAVESDVEGADGDLGPFHPLDLGGDLLGEGDAAGADADQQEGGEVAAVALGDLPRHPANDPSHLLGVEDRRLRRQILGHERGDLQIRGIVWPGAGGCQ